jgi:hypothetical protein
MPKMDASKGATGTTCSTFYSLNKRAACRGIHRFYFLHQIAAGVSEFFSPWREGVSLSISGLIGSSQPSLDLGCQCIDPSAAQAGLPAAPPRLVLAVARGPTQAKHQDATQQRSDQRRHARSEQGMVPPQGQIMVFEGMAERQAQEGQADERGEQQQRYESVLSIHVTS